MTDAELVARLGRDVVRLDRRPYEYASSFPLEAIDATLADGTTLPLLLKCVNAPLPVARAAKPAFLFDPRRESAVYRDVLAGRRLGTPHCYAATDDWLLLERVIGRELYQIGEFDLWLAAARWLGRFHAGGVADGVPLVRHDAAYFRLWPERAGWHLPAYDAIIEQLIALPTTTIHGEFYAANVLIAEDGRVSPVDWETAGVGPGLIDLAALTAGGWSDDDRAKLAEAYRTALGDATPLPVLLERLDWCRLHMALRWLGWSATWQPPAAQANDWHGEATRLAAKLGLL